MIDSIGIDTGIIAFILLVFVVILLICVVSCHMRLGRLEKRYKMFMKGKDAQSLEKTFVRKFAQVDKLSEISSVQSENIISIRKEMDRMFTKYGVIKYDAFDDMGGKLSFVLALLDSSNSGLILNAIHSRDNCFLYLKEIVKGDSYVMLSQEEVEALRKAVQFGVEELENSEESVQRRAQKKRKTSKSEKTVKNKKDGND